jgi:hypothetical protein
MLTLGLHVFNPDDSANGVSILSLGALFDMSNYRVDFRVARARNIEPVTGPAPGADALARDRNRIQTLRNQTPACCI